MFQGVSFGVLLPTDPLKNSPYNCHFGLHLSLDYPVHVHIQFSFDRSVELRFSHAQGCQALKRGSRFHRVIPNLRHQSRRALSRYWVASEIAVHEDCDFVNVFVSSKSYCSFESQSLISLGPDMKVSFTQICIVWHPRSSELDSFFCLTPTCVVVVYFTVLVFALHRDSLMSGACLNASPM